MTPSWKSQLANGRVFELRSKSTRYPPPCGLVLNAAATKYGQGFMRRIDDRGTVDYYSSGSLRGVYVEGIRPDQFTGARIARRRPDLERFDADDLALIRYGYDLDFDGRISAHGDVPIPLTLAPAEWTVFWVPAYTEGFPWPYPDERERPVLGGAWHFDNHGGPAHLGYKFGHAHASRHTGERLARVRAIILRYLPGLIETPVRVVRYTDQQGWLCTTTEYDGECAPLGDAQTTIVETPDGSTICCGPRRWPVTA